MFSHDVQPLYFSGVILSGVSSALDVSGTDTPVCAPTKAANPPATSNSLLKPLSSLHLHDSPSISTVICSSTSALCGNAETPIAARTWRPHRQYLDEQIRGTVNHLRRIIKSLHRIYVPVHADNLFHCVQRAQVLLQHR